MNLVEVKTLITVLEVGSFSEAARQLGYTQSAISQQMASLERSLGLQLFNREARKIRPTQAAVFLHARSLELISLLGRVQNDIERLAAGQVGRIRLGIFASAGAELFSRSLARFLAPRPTVEVTMEDGEPFELSPKIVRGELDLALVFRYDGIPVQWARELAVTDLMIDPVYVIASPDHPLRNHEAVHFSDLANDTWIATHKSTTAYEALLRTTAAAGFTPHIAFHTNNFDAVLGLVRESLGVAMIPRLAMVNDQGLITLPLQGLPQRHIAAVTRAMEHNHLVDDFLLSAQQVAKELTLSHRAHVVSDDPAG